MVPRGGLGAGPGTYCWTASVNSGYLQARDIPQRPATATSLGHITSHRLHHSLNHLLVNTEKKLEEKQRFLKYYEYLLDLADLLEKKNLHLR